MTDTSVRSRILVKGKFWRLCFLGLPLAAFLTGCGEEAPPPAPPAAKVVVTEARLVKMPEEKTFSGTLAAKETVEVRARVSGYVAEKLFEEGSQVEAGQILYKLDDRDLTAALNTAKANTAKAAWENADTTRVRMVELADKGAVSLQQRDTAVAKADEALAAHQAAQAEEEKATVNLGYATIYAPTDGYVSRSNVEVGSNVDAGSATLLATIYKIDPIRAEFSVSDKEYSGFRKRAAESGGRPDSLAFTLALGDDRDIYPHQGTMEMADPIIDPKTNTMGIRVTFPNPEKVLRPGIYVNVTATTGEKEVVVVPEVALVDQTAGKAVYTVDENSALAIVPVTIGPRLGQDRVVSEGLTAGQKVVVEGLVSAHPGQKVEVTAKEAPPATPADNAEPPAAAESPAG